MRDESHRFATTLHKRKRAKRVALTLLEGVPGIRERRSRRLMEIFGSVEAMLGKSAESYCAEGGGGRP